jgi:hypothetical protein
VGDRTWSVRTSSGEIGSGKNSQRFSAVPGLLLTTAEERGAHVDAVRFRANILVDGLDALATA